MEKTKKNVKVIIAIIALCLVTIASLAAYYYLIPRGVEGAKTISVEVIIDGSTELIKEIHTDAAYLRQALDEVNLIGGEDTAFGFWVTKVNGREADDNLQEWWALYINGEFAMLGIDDMPIEDGDIVSYRLTEGFDEAAW
jgi:uncharacterized protein YpmB